MAGLTPRVVVLGHAAEEILAAVDLQGADAGGVRGLGRGAVGLAALRIEALGDVDAAVVVARRPAAHHAARRSPPCAAARSRDAARATYRGAPGHPVLLGRALLARAGELRGDAGFRDLLEGVRDVEVGGLADPADVDTRRSWPARVGRRRRRGRAPRPWRRYSSASAVANSGS